MKHIRKVKEKRLGRYETVRRPYSDEVMGRIAMIDAVGGQLNGVGYRWPSVAAKDKFIYRLDPDYVKREVPKVSDWKTYGFVHNGSDVEMYIDGVKVES